MAVTGQKVYELHNFGGGLVTAVDESLLAPEMSPNIVNCDVTDSLSLSRRSGYAAVTTSPISGQPIKAIYRYYRAGGNHQWMTVAGNTLYAGIGITQAGGELRRKEYTVSNVAATSPTTVDNVTYSGGSAVQSLTTITATAPTGSYLAIGMPDCTASVRVDSGAWLSHFGWQGQSVAPSVSATPQTHSITVKPSFAPVTRNAYQEPYTPPVADYRVETFANMAGDMSWFVRNQGGTTGYRLSMTMDGVWVLHIVGKSPYLAQGTFSPSGGKEVVIEAFGPRITVYIGGIRVARITDSTYQSGAIVATNTYTVRPMPILLDYVDYATGATWSQKDAAISASASTFAFSTLNDKCFYATPYNGTKFYNGASVAVTASGQVNGGFMREHKRRVFTAGANADKALLNYTKLDDGGNYTSGGAIYLAGKDSGGECTGLEVWNNLLYYFSPSRTYSLDTTGQDTSWVAKTISKSHGCVAPNTLVAAPNALVFLSADGVRAYGYLPGVNSDDGSGFMLLSRNITPTLNEFTGEQRAAACGAYYRNRYWLAIGDTVLLCDMEKRTADNQPVWTRYSYKGIGTITCLHVTRGDEYGLYAGSSDGRIYRLDTGMTDNGESIDMVYETPPLALGGYVTTKHFRTLDVAADGSQSYQSITVTPTTDDLDGTTQTVTVSAETAVKPVHVQLNARGRSLKLTITSPGAVQPLSISGLIVRYTPPRMR